MAEQGAGITAPEMEEDPCAAANDDSRQGLRIGAIFIILVTSLFGTLLPIVLRSSKHIPRPVFEFAKYFGSGVIIATAFIHLLAPAFEALGSECLSGAWTDYSWAPAIAMAAVYGIFFAEVAAYRIGSKKLAKLGVNYNSHHEGPHDAHEHAHTDGAHTHGSPTTETSDITPGPGAGQEKKFSDIENLSDDDLSLRTQGEAAGQLIGVAVLEFGVVLHSVIIGLTLAVNDEFITLFVVLIFHQMFEGLGLGSRLSALNLPGKWNYARYVAAIFYSICTPVGVAIGLGVRESYNGNGAKASIISGVLDATSAGILLYTGLVELLAHEILLNPRAMKSSNGKMAYIFVCMLVGSGLMALLGRWA